MREEEKELDLAALTGFLEERQAVMAEHLAEELTLIEEAMAEKAARMAWWEQLITDNQLTAHQAQLSSYQSMAKSLAGLLGGSIREQAKIMIPFEIAEATKEFARFLATRDPAALASSLKHALAARQYAAAARSSAGSSGGGEGGGAGLSRGQARSLSAEEKAGEERGRQTRIIVNVGRQVGLVDTYEFARNLIEAINENLRDDVILEVAS